MGLGTFSGGGLGMGMAFRLEDQFVQTARGIQREMKNLDVVAEHITRKVDRGLTQVAVGATAMGVAIVTAMPLAWGVGLAAKMEQTEIAFTTMLKSAEKARTLIGELQTFADLTPFEPEPVIQSGRALLSYGFAASEVIGELQNVGNVAAGLNIPLQELVEIYGKSKVEGRAYAKDIYQFTGRGIPLIQELAKQFGVADSAVMGLASDGKIQFKHIQKAIADLSNGAGMFAGLMDKQSQSFNGLISTALGYIDRIGIAIGKRLLPMLKPVAAWFGEIAKKLEEFISSPIGGFVVNLVAGFAAFLFVGGLVITMMGMANLAAGFLAKAFVGLNMTSIATAFAQKGLIAGFRQLAASAWAAVVPMWPWILAAGVLFGIYKIGTSAVDAFYEAQENLGKGIATKIGFFEKLGGILLGIGEIWSSFDMETGTFALTDKLAMTLESMGIKDTVLAIGTWIIRLKTMFIGVGEGLGIMWDVAKDAFNALLDFVTPAFDWLDKIGISIGKNTTAMDKWRLAGKVIGIVLGSIILALTVAMIAWGVSSLIAMAPMLAVGILIGLALWGIYEAVVWVVDAFSSLGEIVSTAWDSMMGFFGNMLDTMMGWKDAAIAWGSNFIDWIKEGISSNFSAFISWLTSIFMKIPGVGMIMKFVGGLTGTGDSTEGVTQGGNVSANTGNTEDYMNNTASLKASNSNPYVIDKTTNSTKSVAIQLNMDGTIMHERIVELDNIEKARYE